MRLEAGLETPPASTWFSYEALPLGTTNALFPQDPSGDLSEPG